MAGCPINTGGSAPNLVYSGWAVAQNYASDAFNMANDFIAQLSTAANNVIQIPDIDVDVGTPGVVITPFVMPDSPTSPDLNAQFPVPPSEPTLDAVESLVVPDAPIFDVEAPAVNTDIESPDPLDAALPAEPALDVIAYPSEPVLNFPSEPVLYNITLPDIPTLNFAEFYSEHEPGDMPAAPVVGIEFNEPPFSDELMDAVKSRLLEWVSGVSTGLSPEVEMAIWERARVRENLNMLATLDTVVTEWSARGFELPQGALVVQTQMIAQETANKNSSLSRDIMIKQAELEQTNIHFAIEKSVMLEGELLQYANNVAQRALEVAKLTATIAIDIFNAQVSAYNAGIQAYLADAQVYRTIIEAEANKIELYKGQIEGQKLISDINTQLVQLYREQINAQMARVDVYKVQMEAVRVQADVNRLKIDAFRAMIDAYVAQVQAKTAEFEQYANQIKAEGLKVDLYKSQAQAYSAVVDGYAKNVDALVAVKNSEIRIEQELPLETYKSLIEAFSSQVDGEAKRIGALSDVYRSDVQAFSAEVDGESSRVKSETDVYRAEVDRLIAEANVDIEAAKAEINAMISQVNVLVEAMRAGATVAAQLAASALSAVNLSGSIGEQVSHSNSSSCQTSYSESKSEQTTESQQVIDSYDNRYSENHNYNYNA